MGEKTGRHVSLTSELSLSPWRTLLPGIGKKQRAPIPH